MSLNLTSAGGRQRGIRYGMQCNWDLNATSSLLWGSIVSSGPSSSAIVFSGCSILCGQLPLFFIGIYRGSNQNSAKGRKPASERSPPPKPIRVFGRSSCHSSYLEWSARRGGTTPELLCISLLMSQLATFIAMFGKQWPNHYPRCIWGSVVKRYSDRLRKCGGLEKCKFYLFIEFPHHILDRSPHHSEITVEGTSSYERPFYESPFQTRNR